MGDQSIFSYFNKETNQVDIEPKKNMKLTGEILRTESELHDYLNDSDDDESELELKMYNLQVENELYSEMDRANAAAAVAARRDKAQAWLQRIASQALRGLGTRIGQVQRKVEL